MCDKLIIGYWMSGRKRQKFDWNEFQDVCEAKEVSLKLIDIDRDLESQGPFHIFLHKLTAMLARAENNDKNANIIISRVKEYISKHPELIVIDPLDNIRHLRNRYKSYKMIEEGVRNLYDVFIPNFIEIWSSDICPTLVSSYIKYPFVCKPLIAHGSSDAHKMMIIFNKRGLIHCREPCVAQAFINHNAILYKVFVIGDRFHVVKRPSLKNFYQEDCASMDTIFFNSQDISKSGSKSKWSVISEADIPLTVGPNHSVFKNIAKRIPEIFGLFLVGVDVVIENHTGKYAIIDVNVFPGYDGYPDFFENLTDSFRKLSLTRKVYRPDSKYCTLKNCSSDDSDSRY